MTEMFVHLIVICYFILFIDKPSKLLISPKIFNPTNIFWYCLKATNVSHDFTLHTDTHLPHISAFLVNLISLLADKIKIYIIYNMHNIIHVI